VECATIHERPAALGTGTPADPRLVVETWLAVPAKDGGWRVLLLRRAPQHGGFWQGVSGRVESCDASLAQAALREIREETGIEAGVRVFDLGRWIEFRGFTGTVYRKRSLGAVLPADVCEASVVLSDEHDSVALLPFDEARALIRWPENAEELTALERAVLAPPAAG
jgi:8-oxo-dGTP pyrophosphatase MutT (NUDIX family)